MPTMTATESGSKELERLLAVIGAQKDQAAFAALYSATKEKAVFHRPADRQALGSCRGNSPGSLRAHLAQREFLLFVAHRIIVRNAASASANLLDDVFELFKRELAACDPDYAGQIGLALLNVETIAPAYFSAREQADPFAWAASNLAEAEQNKTERETVFGLPAELLEPHDQMISGSG